MDELFGLEKVPEKAGLLSSIRKYRILSTLPYEKMDFWNSCVVTEKAKPNQLNGNILKKFYFFFLHVFKLIHKNLTGNFDLILLTGGEKSDLIYLLMVSLILWKKTPHFIVTAEWAIPKSRMQLFIQRSYFKLVMRSLVEIQTLSDEEINIYSESFSIPKKKLKSIPFSTTVIGYDFSPIVQDFVLTGGMSHRDYGTFMKAAIQIPLSIEVGIPSQSGFKIDDFTGDKNIKIHYGLSRRQFMEKTSQCRIFALPIVPQIRRSVGDQSILNAMYFGKIVIATNSIGPRIYIRHGINGFLVPEADSNAWVETINKVISMSEQEYQRISSNAAYTAKVVFSEENRLLRILSSANDFLSSLNPV